MESSKLSALLILSMLAIASASRIEPDCAPPHPKPHPLPHPHPHPHPHPKPHPTPKTPVTPLPPVVKPPVVVPPITVPTVPIPKVPILPPVIIVPPKIPVLPPVVPVLPPVIPVNPPKGGGGVTPCPPPPAVSPPASCPIDSLKLGACVDLLGGLIHIGLGDPAANECCPIISGLVELEAAVCLCTTIRLKALNINLYLPIALQLLLTCGKTPPPGYTCSI